MCCVRIYIKNQLFLKEVNSLSQRSILTVNNFYLSKVIRLGEKTCDGELSNTTPKYQNASTHSRRIINNKKTYKPRVKLQEKNPLKERTKSNHVNL